MKHGSLALLAVCISMTTFAQDQGSSSAKPAPSAAQQKTVTGCLTGYDGHYTLGTSGDQLFLLDGDPALFKRYNAKMVKATGTVSEPSAGSSKNNVLSQQPPTMVVSTLKKVADGCN